MKINLKRLAKAITTAIFMPFWIGGAFYFWFVINAFMPGILCWAVACGWSMYIEYQIEHVSDIDSTHGE